MPISGVRALCLFFLAIVCLFGVGCGFSPAHTPQISPASVTLTVSQSQQFVVAPLAGGTVWQVNEVTGGNASLGTVSPSGMYTAPAVPLSATLTITASSREFPGITAFATVQVVNPAPQVTGVTPNITVVYPLPLDITVTGRGFTQQSVVVAEGNGYPTTFVNSSQLQAIIPPSVLQGASKLAISVNTPAPGGGRSTPEDILVVTAGTVTPTAQPLVAQYDISLPTDGLVSVEFGPDLNYGRRTWARPVPAGGGHVTLLVAGMHPVSTYHMRARLELTGGGTLWDTDHTFTTGPLPSVPFPSIAVTQTPGMSNGGGVELLSAFTSYDGAIALDTDGSVIWYDPAIIGGVFPIRQLQNGDFLLNYVSSVREVDLTGQIVRQITHDELQTALTAAGYSLQLNDVHHDVIGLPNGHWILLVSENRDFQDLPGYPGVTTVLGDALIDLDPTSKPVWVWRAFDHLDVNRHPFMFPDWTHANAIVYTPDGNLLLSMRHQNWIIKIDYADGKGTGSVLWRLGPDGDFSLAGGDPAQWFYDQHFPALLSSHGSQFAIALYDNGDTRPESSGQPCYQNGTCYSRAVLLNADESARTADIAWQYAPGWYSFWGGSISVLPNGNVEFDSTTINGGTSRVIEVTPGDPPQIVWRMDTPDAFLYRAYRIPSLYPGVQW